MALTTRTPTGKAGWPNLLVEGPEKSWKTATCLKFTADRRIGQAFVIEVGEARADEYAALGKFEIVEWDRTVQGFVQAVRDVMAVAPLDGKPNLLIIDTGTGAWDLVKRRAEHIARSSAQALATLAKDANAEITVGHQAWNKAKDPYWWGWLNELRAWPGISLIVCRADEVSKFQNGQPVANQTEYRVEIESGTRFIMDGQVRVFGPRAPAKVITAASLLFSVPDGGLELPEENPLGHLVFELFKAGTSVTLDRAGAARAVVAACVTLGDDDTPTEADPDGRRTDAKIRAGKVWRSIYPDVSPTEFDGDAMRVLLDAVAADAAETQPPDGAGGPAGDAGTDGAGKPSEASSGDPGVPGDPDPVTPGADHADATTVSDPPGPADDGARDVTDDQLDKAPADPSTTYDDPEVEAEAFALAYVSEKVTTKTKCVAELALRGIAASVKGSQLPDLQSRLVDVIRDERLGVRKPPSGLSDTAPPNGGPASVAEQQALT